jgi:hypothetical protein
MDLRLERADPRFTQVKSFTRSDTEIRGARPMTVSRSGVVRQVRPVRPPGGFPQVWGPDRACLRQRPSGSDVRGLSPGSQGP